MQTLGINKLALITIPLLIASNGWAAKVYGTMECKVKDVMAAEIKDGVSKIYSGIEGIKKGDFTQLSYRLGGGTDNQSDLRIELKDTRGDDMLVSLYNVKTTRKQEASNNFGVALPEMIHVRGRIQKDDVLSLSSDMFDVTGALGDVLILERYYKGDWNGIYKGGYGLVSKVFTVDCRHGIDKYDELLEVLEEYAD